MEIKPDEITKILRQRIEGLEAEAADLSEASEPVLGVPGPPVNRRSPFIIGMLAAAGVAVTYGVVELIVSAANILALIGLSLFLAIGLEPAVAWLTRHRVRRGGAVAIVAVVVLVVMGGFLAAAIPPLIAQVEAFVRSIPDYIAQMRDHSTTLGHLDERFHIQQNAKSAVSSFKLTSLTGGLLSVGKTVLSVTVSALTVIVLTVYLLADLPRIRRLVYRLTPASRRARVILIGDEVQAKVGGFVLGNLITSLIAGVGTFIWLLAFGVPYPVVLAILVALLDLIPIVGSTVAGVIVSLVALTVSFPVAISTAAFYIVYRLLEDYLIVPRIIGRTVRVPATVTFVAVLVGGTALGLIGALVAIPIAATIDILLRETVFPRLDDA
ncbi:MAG TPA: AI-2E family transporter [Micromonosporaceae bacterium]